MSSTALVLHNGVVVTPAGVLSGHDVVIEGTQITEVAPSGMAGQDQLGDTKVVDVGGAFISPGLIDVHTHGAMSRSFAETDRDAYDTILRFHAANGITRVHASLPTADFDGLDQQLAWVQDYKQPADGAELHGVHLEGPYLSHEDQARGAANPAFLRTPQPGDAERLLQHDVLTMMTIAPELPGAIDLIRALADRGVAVAIGHSSAEREAFDDAVDAGARHITHLWSGMTNLLRREAGERVPGMIECSLASDTLTGEVIADGYHLPPELLTIARRCLGGAHARLCLISDASIGTGMPEGYRYGTEERPVEVRNGVANLVGQGRFAGSTTPLNVMAGNLLRQGWPVDEVIMMASTVPARVLSLGDRKGVIAPGYDADIALFDRDLQCLGSLIGGVWAKAFQPAVT